MKVRLSHVHTGLRLFLENVVAVQLLGGQVDLSYDGSLREVTVIGKRGIAIARSGASDIQLGWEYCTFRSESGNSKGERVPGLVRFSPVTLYGDLNVEMGEPVLRLRLPLCHQLPWPRYRECDSYYTPEQVMADCELRRDSAKSVGAYAEPPPPELQRTLSAQQRVKLFDYMPPKVA